MNWGLLFSIVNFAALVFILRKLLRKPLAKFLKNRSDLVANRLAEIKTVKLNADRRHRDSEWRFAKIDKEIETLRSSMETSGKHEYALLIKRAEEQQQRIEVETKRQIEQDELRAEQELIHKVLQGAFEQAEKSLNEGISKESKQEMFQSSLDCLSHLKPFGSDNAGLRGGVK